MDMTKMMLSNLVSKLMKNKDAVCSIVIVTTHLFFFSTKIFILI